MQQSAKPVSSFAIAKKRAGLGGRWTQALLPLHVTMRKAGYAMIVKRIFKVDFWLWSWGLLVFKVETDSNSYWVGLSIYGCLIYSGVLFIQVSYLFNSAEKFAPASDHHILKQ